jgi:hypothetical protein
MKNIVLALVIFIAAMEARGNDMQVQEFEFELTDVFYPLLTKEESAKLSQKMLENARTSVFYKGKVKRINSKEWRKFALKRLILVPKKETSERERWEKPQSVVMKDGKLRIKALKSVDEAIELTSYTLEGSIGIDTISISLPMEPLAEILGEKLYSPFERNRYIEFEIYAKEEKGNELYNKGYISASKSSIPIDNDRAKIHNPATNKHLNGHYGMRFHTAVKLSLVKDDKTRSSDEPSLISKKKKIYAISSGQYIGDDDAINVEKIKGLPENLADIRVRYLNGKRFEQFTLYARAKNNDDVLAGVFMSQIKTHGKLYRIDAAINDQSVEYYNDVSLGVDESRAACIFGFGIEFHEDGEVRYFSEPKDDNPETRNKFVVGSVKYATEHNITKGDLTPLLEYEKKNAAYLEDKPNADAKTAACKDILSYAKHILSAPKEELEKEFDEQYKTVGAAYEAERKRFERKVDESGAIVYPDGSKRAKNGNIIYPNGNELEIENYGGCLYFSEQLYCKGKFRDGIMIDGYNGATYNGEIIYKDKNGNKFIYSGNFKNGIPVSGVSTKIHTKTFYIKISEYDDENKKYKEPAPTLKDGKFEGEVYVSVWENFHLHKFIKTYTVVFKNGRIVQHDGINEEILKMLEEWLEKFNSVKCDVNHAIGDKS